MGRMPSEARTFLTRITTRQKTLWAFCHLSLLFGDENTSQQSNKKLLTTEDLQLVGETTTKLARTASTQGIDAGALKRRSMLEILMYFALVLIL